jgi:hypothetical protein
LLNFIQFDYLHTEWDAPYNHIPEDIPEEYIDQVEKDIASFFDEGLGYQEGDYENPIGAELTTTVHADTFDELMEKISELESELSLSNCEQWEFFEETVEYIRKGYIKGE